MRRGAAAAVVAVMMAGCGGGDKRDATTTTTTEATAAGDSHLAVELRLEGAYSAGAVHLIRVEHPDGKQVFERPVGPERRLRASLAPGRYRMLSFQRECTGSASSCGLEPGSVGEPVDLCGSYFEVRDGTVTTAVVALAPTQGCTIEFS